MFHNTLETQFWSTIRITLTQIGFAEFSEPKWAKTMTRIRKTYNVLDPHQPKPSIRVSSGNGCPDGKTKFNNEPDNWQWIVRMGKKKVPRQVSINTKNKTNYVSRECHFIERNGQIIYLFTKSDEICMMFITGQIDR